VFQKVDKGIAAVEINPAAGLRGSNKIIVGIEPAIGLAALGCSIQQVMREGVHARGGDVGIVFQIKRGVEEFPAQEEAADGSLESTHFYNLSRETS
jgi:hypothetical protein